MRVFGNLSNRLMENDHDKPEVGMGATELLYSDRHAYTISRVSESGKTFWMKRDKAIPNGCPATEELHDYTYIEQPDEPEVRVNMTKYGWKIQKSTSYVAVGIKDEYYDPTF